MGRKEEGPMRSLAAFCLVHLSLAPGSLPQAAVVQLRACSHPHPGHLALVLYLAWASRVWPP